MAVDFRATQAEFAAYIRDPANNPIPLDVSPERMAMYHELFFNNIDGFLTSNFPVLRQILTDQQWLALAQDFFANHHCSTPHFSEIAEEFLAYLQNRQHPDDYPFLLELAHYEWVELALSIAKDNPKVADAQLLVRMPDVALAVSPLAWPLAYSFPVQLISKEYLPSSPPETPSYLIVYRDQEYAVHFMQCSPLTFGLLQWLQENPGQTCSRCLQDFIKQFKPENPKVLLAEGQKMFNELLDKGIVIAFTDV